MTEAKKRGPKEVTAQHKAAMQAGRTESKSVRDYLEALQANKPKRGRKRTSESVQKRLAAIETEFADADALTKLNLIQEQMDLHVELNEMGSALDISALEAEFVAVASVYGKRKGISFEAWRAIGVESDVLRAAGISRLRH